MPGRRCSSFGIVLVLAVGKSCGKDMKFLSFSSRMCRYKRTHPWNVPPRAMTLWRSIVSAQHRGMPGKGLRSNSSITRFGTHFPT